MGVSVRTLDTEGCGFGGDLSKDSRHRRVWIWWGVPHRLEKGTSVSEDAGRWARMGSEEGWIVRTLGAGPEWALKRGGL